VNTSGCKDTEKRVKCKRKACFSFAFPSAKYLRRSQRYEKSRAKQRNSFFFCRDGV